MPPAAGTQQALLAVVERFEVMEEELGELVDLAKVESKQRRELIQTIGVVHAWLGQQIRLEVRRWGGILKDVSAAYLGREGTLVTLDWHGNATTRALEQLDPRIFSAVVQDAASRMLRSVSAKVTETNKWRKPEIKARVQSDEGGFLGIGRHLYSLSLINSGGSSRDLRVSLRTTQRAHGYGPLKLRRDGEIALDLRRVTELESTARLPVEVNCKDIGERLFHGAAMLKIKSRGWQKIPLSEVKPTEETVSK